MKTNHLILKGILCIIFTSLIFSCDKKEVEEIEVNSLHAVAGKSEKEVTTRYSMDARFASLYALQYAKAIDPEFQFEPGSSGTPKFITGRDVMSFVNLEKLPVKREEISFIKEVLYKEGSRAVLIQDVKDVKNRTEVNVLYIPYPTDIEVPEDYVFQNGVMIDDWQAAYLPPFLWASIGLEGAGSYCSCMITLRNFNTICSACPDLSTNLLTFFEEFIEGGSGNEYETILNSSVAIEKIPLGESIFSYQ